MQEKFENIFLIFLVFHFFSLEIVRYVHLKIKCNFSYLGT